jgi:hypothetical protein
LRRVLKYAEVLLPVEIFFNCAPLGHCNDAAPIYHIKRTYIQLLKSEADYVEDFAGIEADRLNIYVFVPLYCAGAIAYGRRGRKKRQSKVCYGIPDRQGGKPL